MPLYRQTEQHLQLSVIKFLGLFESLRIATEELLSFYNQTLVYSK